jgi:hypothetical protein
MGGVLTFPAARRPPYQLVWSGPAQTARDELPPDRRQQLLDAAVKLSLDPRPQGASPAEERGRRRWTVELLPGLQAEYSIAEERRFVMLFRIRHTR